MSSPSERVQSLRQAWQAQWANMSPSERRLLTVAAWLAGLTLVVAVLRKELALQLLVTLAMIQYGPQASNLLTFMRPEQIVVYALVNTLYVPCIATIAVLARELGWRRALLISGFTVALALVVGRIARLVLSLL